MPVVGSTTQGAAQGDVVNLFDHSGFATYSQYFVKETARERKNRWIWSNLIGSSNWTTNMGPIKTTVRTQMAPLGNQSASGWADMATQNPTIDRSAIGESTRQVRLSWKDYESPLITWRAEFYNFIKESIEPNRVNLERYMARDTDIFIRSNILAQSPFVWVAGVGLVSTTPETWGPNGFGSATYKNRAWLAEQLQQCNSTLNIAELAKILNAATETLGIPPASGDELAKDGTGFSGKYKIVTDGTTKDSWTDDPFVQALKPNTQGLVNAMFGGDIFGRLQFVAENTPWRFASTANDSTGTLEHAPEIASARDQYDGGEPVPNPNYGSIAQSPWQISYLMGDSKMAYRAVGVQPPPAAFTKVGMDWNGKVKLIKPAVVVEPNSAGTATVRGNDRSRYVQMIATMTQGIEPVNNRYILPIIHKRSVFTGKVNV